MGVYHGTRSRSVVKLIKRNRSLVNTRQRLRSQSRPADFRQHCHTVDIQNVRQHRQIVGIQTTATVLLTSWSTGASHERAMHRFGCVQGDAGGGSVRHDGNQFLAGHEGLRFFDVEAVQLSAVWLPSQLVLCTASVERFFGTFGMRSRLDNMNRS